MKTFAKVLGTAAVLATVFMLGLGALIVADAGRQVGDAFVATNTALQ